MMSMQNFLQTLLILDHSSMGTLEPDIVKKADDRTLKTSCISCHPNVGHVRK